MAENGKPVTPMVRQYLDIKKEHQDKVLFFRLGDFYEMFEDDAERVSKILNLTLTHRGDMPMCGIPYHAAKNYIKRLLDYGLKVALCEQFLDGEETKGLARREVTKVFTPGTVLDEEYLDSFSSSFVVAVNADSKGSYAAWTDISTGEFKIRTMPLEKDFATLESLLAQISPKEILVPDDLYFTEKKLRIVVDAQNTIVTKLPLWYFSTKNGRRYTEEQFSSNVLHLLDIGEKDPVLTPIGALLGYLKDTAKTELPQLKAIERVGEDTYLYLNSAVVRNLELLQSTQDGNVKYSLFGSIDKTLTPSGSRFLKFSILHPLSRLDDIEYRLNWVKKLLDDRRENDRVRKYLAEASDLERLSVKAGMMTLTPRNLLAIAESVSSFFSLVEGNQEYLSLMDGDVDLDYENIITFAEDCMKAINRECTNVANEGTIILPGYDSELDQLREFKENGAQILSDYLERLREETGITTMKIGDNRIIGSYLEVSKGQLDKVPEYFIRRQTLVNGERFTTPELDEIKEKLWRAEENARRRENEVYGEFLRKAKDKYIEIGKMAEVITRLDFFSSLAKVAEERNYCRPTILESGELEIVDGRHPVVELYTEAYVSNSFSTRPSRFSLITGPNMAGKSTYLREIALITLLAHMGSFVPAKEAAVPLTDKIFCRVGASDNLSRGESTFLVEMSESAQILRSATGRSLVIMDEIGRGTSTQDGMSLAYAIEKYLMEKGAVTLFATHYHELTMLDTTGIQLLHMAVREERSQVTFLRKAVEGVAESSYGIHVAKLAGLPREVISEANSFQRKHFADYTTFDATQGNLFMQEENEKEENEVVEALRDFDVENSTPLEALMLLVELKKKLK